MANIAYHYTTLDGLYGIITSKPLILKYSCLTQFICQ